MATRGQQRSHQRGRGYSRGLRVGGARGSHQGDRGERFVQPTSGFNFEDIHQLLQQVNNCVSILSTRVGKLENRGPDSITDKPTRATTRSAGPSTHINNNVIHSTNPDFPEVCKSVYRQVQLRHHLDNWTSLPKSLQDRLKKLVQDINPPMSNEDFRRQLTAATDDYIDKIVDVVKRHMKQCLIQKEADAGGLSRVDIDRATDVATKYLTTRLGRRLDATKRTALVKNAADTIGRHFQPPPSLPANIQASSPPLPSMDDQWHVVGSPRTVPFTPGKRKAQSSPIVTPTSNRFQILDGDVEDHDDDDDDDDSDPSSLHPPVQHSTTKPRQEPTSKSRSVHPSQPVQPSAKKAKTFVPVQHSPKQVQTARSSRSLLQDATSKPASQPPPKSSLASGHPHSGVQIYSDGGDDYDWRIHPHRDTHTVVVGDFNLRHITGIPDGWEIHCRPDANLYQTLQALHGLPKDPPGHYHVIIQSGINHRNDSSDSISCWVHRLVGALQRNPAVTEFRQLAVSTSHSMRSKHVTAMKFLNERFIHEITEENCLPPLLPEDVVTESDDPDGVCYTAETTAKIFTAIFTYYHYHMV